MVLFRGTVGLAASVAVYLGGYEAFAANDRRKRTEGEQRVDEILELGKGEGRSSGASWREEILRRLASEGNYPSKQNADSDVFDVLIVGGGATGAGCALDAATRGLKTALVEREDFSSGTSSRSTKLLHGGVRYLEKAVFNMDYGQLKLVFEALHERSTVMKMAPHLTSALPILMPCYRTWEVPYFWAGMKAYDFLSGTRMLGASYANGVDGTLSKFPMLKSELSDGEKLCGSVTYYDGLMDDSRLNVLLATTAESAGAVVANYIDIVDVLKDERDHVIGVQAVDRITGKKMKIRAKAVVNAAGPFCDGLRSMADKNAQPTVTPAAGAHVTLPASYTPDSMGMIIPKTKDGRVLFVLPWMGVSLAGTTDSPSAVTMRPKASQEDVSFILESMGGIINVPATSSDVLSTWCGLRPLASDPSKTNTESISRDHVCYADKNGMISITGGKWTTFRKMAKDAIDLAVSSAALETRRECCTEYVRLHGGHNYNPQMYSQIAERLAAIRGDSASCEEFAKHLANAYGDRAWEVLDIAEKNNLASSLVRGQNIIEAEVVFSARNELCVSASDFLARRTRIAFTDIKAARAAIPRVIQLLKRENGWSAARTRRETREASSYLETFGCP